MIQKIDHLGLVVNDLTEGIRLFRDGLGLELQSEEYNPEFNCKLAFFRCGEVMLELIEPTGPGPSREFLHKTGGGFHHICYEVGDIKRAMEFMKKNFILRDKNPRAGAGGSKVFFLEPESVFNIETEFVELKK